MPDMSKVHFGMHFHALSSPITEKFTGRVFPHTARVVSAAHTQHCPLMSEQPPVDDVTEHGPFTRVTSVAAPQLQRSPHTAIVVFCVSWRYAAGWSCASSSTPAT